MEALRVFRHYALDAHETIASTARKLRLSDAGLYQRLTVPGRLRVDDAVQIAKALHADPAKFLADIVRS